MPENFNGSANAGSPIGSGVPNPNSFGGTMGQTPANQVPQIDPEQHKELESLVGRQGAELGEYRKFFQDVAPLLDKLDKSPEIVQAILGDKLTVDLAKAAMEGKVTIGDAKIVSQAHETVKKELGAAAYAGASAEDITKLIEAKAQEIKAEVDNKFKTQEEMVAFDNEIQDFISRTGDFSQYAKEVEAWIDEHPNITDIAVAYYAVKGEMSEKEARKQAGIDNANYQKNLAINTGGGDRATFIRGGENEVIDSLISTKANPNVF